ncbi:MFS transporter [Halomicrococcus gelatinilyticus]|uniref:MFS transporter n=1 Tax=Halomicrococcus gelatinilyticus TaxID=1702103 RepID=UPI002E0F7303
MSSLRRNASFVRLFLGRLATNAGDSLYFIGAMWLVYHLTGSSLYTGIAGFLVQLPTSVQFLFGPLVDRWELRRVLVGTQVVQGVFVLAVPLAAATGHLSVWVVLVVMPVLSLINQFVYPAQTAVLPRIVDDENLVRANSLFSTAYQGADVVFNAAGGAILAVVGATTLFVVDSVTFAVAAFLFVGLTIPTADAEDAVDDEVEDANDATAASEADGGTDSEDADAADSAEDVTDADDGYLADLREGIDYLRGSVVLSMVLGAMVSNVGGGAMMAVLPAFADTLGGPETYGLLMAATAGGSLVGAAAASLVEDTPYGPFSIVGFTFSSVALFTVPFAPGPLSTAILIAVSLTPIGAFNVMFSSMLQSSVDEALLGRVSAVVSSLTAVMIPVGNLIGGAVGEAIAPGAVLYLLAGTTLLLAVYFLVHPRIRSLPSVSEADETTLGLPSASDS